jgi:hypothetical protein
MIRLVIEPLARLYHDAGKIDGTKHHAERSVDIIKETFPLRLTNEKAIIDGVVKIVAHHMKLYDGVVTRARVKRLASQGDIFQLVRMYQADKFSRGLGPMELLRDVDHLQKFLTIYDEIQNEVLPIVKGRDIVSFAKNVRPGPLFGEILDILYQDQLDDKFSTYEDGITCLKTLLIEKYGGIKDE